MCHQNINLYLHCSHIAIDDPEICTSAHGECAKYLGPTVHSYLLCCPTCRGKVEHARYLGQAQKKLMCSTHDTEKDTLPTCARLVLGAQNSSMQARQERQSHQASEAAAFPYGLGQASVHADLQQVASTQNSVTSVLVQYPADTEYIENVLRFPFTKCSHLIPYDMPLTRLDEASDSVLPCGCWTGKAPDPQITNSALFGGYVGAHRAFKGVWEVTGLGTDGCWKCGEVETSAPAYDNNNGVVNASVVGRINEETGQVLSKEEAFLTECEEWQDLQNWKNEFMSGDVEERGAILMAGSRWRPE